MKENQGIISEDDKFPVLFESNLSRKSRRRGSKRLGVKKNNPLQKLQIPKRRLSSSALRTNISQSLEASKEDCGGRVKISGRSRSFLRPVTAQSFFQPCRKNSSGQNILTTERIEKNARWRKKEEMRERTRAEVYAINELLRLKFESNFNAFLNEQDQQNEADDNN